MATQRSKPASRKRRRHAGSGSSAAAPVRVEAPAEQPARPVRPARPARPGSPRLGSPRPGPRGASQLGAYGERPPGPFGGVPVAEIAIAAGLVALVFGLIKQGGPALIGGVVLCLLGVTEVTAREHFSGYRSHTVLLAGIPAVAAELVIALVVGTPTIRVLLLVPVVAVFGVCAWFLRRRFLVARQARLAKPPALRE